ncbi:MAG: AMP-binding protein, partial [Methylobacter sp.]
MNKTFIDVLRNRADTLAEHTAYRFLVQGTVDGAIESISYAALLLRAKAIAAMLAGQGACGERVLLLYPSGLSFIEAFFGVLFAGATPVPVQTAKAGEQQAFLVRLQRIAENAEARVVVTDTAGMPQAAGLPQLQWINSDLIPLVLAESWRDPSVNAESNAFLQYTSGSTRLPRGVKVSHANLIANCEAIGNAGFGHGSDALIFNWMPHYHDMGLVGGLLYPLFAGATSVLMSPQSFLRQPSRWLQAISHFQATSSGGAFEQLPPTYGATTVSMFHGITAMPNRTHRLVLSQPRPRRRRSPHTDGRMETRTKPNPRREPGVVPA